MQNEELRKQLDDCLEALNDIQLYVAKIQHALQNCDKKLTVDELEQIRYGHTLEQAKADATRVIEDYNKQRYDDYMKP